MLLFLKNISIAFDSKPLLDSADLIIKNNEKIGLIGRNGAGKSTLLKIIAGDIFPDTGEIFLQKGSSIAYLSQEIPILSGSIYQIIASAFKEEGRILSDFHRLSISQKPEETIPAEAVAYLDNSEGWSKVKDIDMILGKLDLDPDLDYQSLSIGLKRRTLLARELVKNPDILLLDEPTNHLDISSIIYLEEFLNRYQKSVILITHDRSFLESVVNGIYELDRGKLLFFNCSYKEYLKRKEAMIVQEEESNRQFDKKLSEEEAWLRQGIKARRTRNEGRVRALEKLRAERKKRREFLSKGSFSSQDTVLSGKKVISAENISFSYGDKDIIRDFSTVIMRKDKVAIIGDNGCGKTTLVKLLLKEIAPRRGIVEHGTKLTVSYFDQSRASLDPEKNLLDNISEYSDQILFNGRHIHLYTYLQKFLFNKEQVQKKAKSLSGGERNRLLLAKLFSRPANLLVLDEPTNDLDTETLELLENILYEFEGTAIIVSHDRTFIDNVVNSAIIFQKDGSIIENAGGYENWQIEKKTCTQKPPRIVHEKKEKHKKIKLSHKEKIELRNLPGIIEEMEAEQNELINQMSEPGFFKQTSIEIKKAQKRLKELEELLENKFELWHKLEELNSR